MPAEYPWGLMKDHEQMSYVLGDAKPEMSTVHGEGSTTIECPAARWSGVSSSISAATAKISIIIPSVISPRMEN